MAEIRTSDVDDLLSVLAALDDPDAIFALSLIHISEPTRP